AVARSDRPHEHEHVRQGLDRQPRAPVPRRRAREGRGVRRLARLRGRPLRGVRGASRVPVTEAPARDEKRIAYELIAAIVVVSGVVTAVSHLAPKGAAGTAIGFIFLAATWALVWRGDDERVRRAGLALGGLVMPGKLDPRGIAKAGLVAL